MLRVSCSYAPQKINRYCGHYANYDHVMHHVCVAFVRNIPRDSELEISSLAIDQSDWPIQTVMIQ